MTTPDSDAATAAIGAAESEVPDPAPTAKEGPAVQENATNAEESASAGDEVKEKDADHKRKLEDISVTEVPEVIKPEDDVAAAAADGEAETRIEGGEKRQRVDGTGDSAGDNCVNEKEALESTVTSNGDGELPAAYSVQPTLSENPPKVAAETAASDANVPQQMTTRTMEVPNNKVGVLIGRLGETIRSLQNSSGAKVQITKDADADPNSTTRSVELIGSLESVTKAEHLIREVIAEAEAGGSPALAARGFVQSGTEEIEMQVPTGKVGLVIGKGGDVIKSIQTKSGARVQLVPLNGPEAAAALERTIRITGNKKQIETAKEFVNQAIAQKLPKHMTQQGGLGQETYHPYGPSGVPPQWGHPPQMPPQHPPTGYDYQQQGMPPSQTMQYPSQNYGGYSEPQRGPTMPQQQPQANVYGPPASVPPNYGSYGQPQGPGYSQPMQYAHSGPPPSYGQGYADPRYANQAPNQLHGAPLPPQGYTQQLDPYGRPVYGRGQQQQYGQPMAPSPGNMYQGQPLPYSQMQYPPYNSNMPAQTAQPYGQAYGAPADGYSQPPAAGYSQGSQVPPYGQGIPAPSTAYAPPDPSSYGQYPQVQQQTYAGQVAPNSANYGYQAAPVDPSYGAAYQSSGYAAAPQPGGQAGYAQPGYAGPPGGNAQSYVHTQPPSQQAGYAGQQPGVAPAAP